MRRRICALTVTIVAWLGLSLPAPAGAGVGPALITYSVEGRGNASSLEDFANQVAAIYADPRGWSLAGSIRFERVGTGGDFTLWLASDGEMPTFGGACDHQWSCRNGRHVVINEDRWLGASESWLEAGATPAAYRPMVLNHETGHWFGLGHTACPRPGSAAPVMQQQSMTLAGCTPNPWPLPPERAILAARRGVAVLQADENPCGRFARAVLRPWTRCL